MRFVWIFDRDDTSQGFPRGRLLTLVVQRGPATRNLELVRARGCGETICRWEDLLDNVERLCVETSELQRIVSGGEEWFFDLDAVYFFGTGEIRFGLHDSAALFIWGLDADVEAIAGGFMDVRLGNPSHLMRF